MNIKNNDQKCFLCCPVRRISQQKYIQKELLKTKNFLMILIMTELNFLQKKRILVKLKRKVSFASIFFVLKMNIPFQFTFQIKKFENSMDLLLIIRKNKLHYVYIKEFNRFMFHKTRHKKYAKVVLATKLFEH